MTKTAPEIAKICYEAISKFHANHNHNDPKLSWEELPDFHREALIDVTIHAMEYSGQSPKENHEYWKKRMEKAGWRYDPVKDFNLKTHPCIVDFDKLSEFEQEKNKIFLQFINTLKLGLNG